MIECDEVLANERRLSVMWQLGICQTGAHGEARRATFVGGTMQTCALGLQSMQESYTQVSELESSQ